MRNGEKMPPSRGGNGQEGLSREQLEALRREREAGQRRITQAEFGKFVSRANQNFLSLASRQETHLSTERRLNRGMAALVRLFLGLAERQGFEISEEDRGDLSLLTDFLALYEDSFKRHLAWRKEIESLRTVSLDDLRTRVETWNADEDNPRMSLMSFGPEWVMERFGPRNPDPMPKEQRAELLTLLEVPEDLQNIVLNGGLRLSGSPSQPS